MNATATQIASKTEYRLVRWQSESDESKHYYLLVRKSDRLATDCNCGDRVHRGHKSGRCCKHMKKFNTSAVTPLEKRTGTVSQAAVVEVIERYAQECNDMYGKLAETKRVEPDTCRYCGRICKGGVCGKCAA